MSDAGVTAIGVTACNQQIDLHHFNIVGEKYLLSIADATRAWPLVRSLFYRAYLTSARWHSLYRLTIEYRAASFSGEPSEAGTYHDPKRDATNLPLLNAAIDADVSVLAFAADFRK